MVAADKFCILAAAHVCPDMLQGGGGNDRHGHGAKYIGCRWSWSQHEKAKITFILCHPCDWEIEKKNKRIFNFNNNPCYTCSVVLRQTVDLKYHIT